MDKAEQSTLSKGAFRFFHALLSLYPKEYRRRFGQEMYFVFQDMCEEELSEKGSISFLFWARQITDVTKGIFEQHMQAIQRKGMKKYLEQTFSINRYNVIGFFLLLPALSVISIDVVSRITQRDLFHYNRPVYNFLSHTPLYSFPILFTWVILFPTLAVFINLISLFLNKKKTAVFSLLFVKRNSISLLILSIGLLFLVIIRLHDFAPCVVHGIILKGIGNLPRILTVCQKA